MKNKKTIFITGAASGIGRETALLFARKGWYVGLFDINEEGLKSLGAEIGNRDMFHAQYMDVVDPGSVRASVESFIDHTGGAMHVLFNNAGIIKFGHFETVNVTNHHRIVDVNLKGILNCTHCALEYLKSTPGARIINMSSTSAIYGVPDLSVYSASKHAVCAMTEAWDLEFRKHGVTVSDILAPYVNTPLLDVPEKVYSMETMGIDFHPAEIAETVWKAAHGNKLHWKIGNRTHLLIALFWLMPFLKRHIVKTLTIPPEGRR